MLGLVAQDQMGVCLNLAGRGETRKGLFSSCSAPERAASGLAATKLAKLGTCSPFNWKA